MRLTATSRRPCSLYVRAFGGWNQSRTGTHGARVSPLPAQLPGAARVLILWLGRIIRGSPRKNVRSWRAWDLCPRFSGSRPPARLGQPTAPCAGVVLHRRLARHRCNVGAGARRKARGDSAPADHRRRSTWQLGRRRPSGSRPRAAACHKAAAETRQIILLLHS